MTSRKDSAAFKSLIDRPSVLVIKDLNEQDCTDVFRHVLEQHVVSSLPEIMQRTGIRTDDMEFLKQLKDDLTETATAWIASDNFISLLADMTEEVIRTQDISIDEETEKWISEMIPVDLDYSGD